MVSAVRRDCGRPFPAVRSIELATFAESRPMLFLQFLLGTSLMSLRAVPAQYGKNLPSELNIIILLYYYYSVVSDVDRVECFRLTLRFFDDVSTAS